MTVGEKNTIHPILENGWIWVEFATPIPRGPGQIQFLFAVGCYRDLRILAARGRIVGVECPPWVWRELLVDYSVSAENLREFDMVIEECTAQGWTPAERWS